MENKNTLIALMLMMAIWFGYSLFFQPHPPVSPDVPVVNSDGADKNIKENDFVKSVPVQNVTPVLNNSSKITNSDNSVRKITVENELYKAVFSSLGGRLISLEMKKYRETTDPQSPNIFLVTQSGFPHGTLNTSGSDGVGFSSDSVYSINFPDDYVHLNPGEDFQLVFTLTRPDGVKIDKIFNFNGSQYPIDFSLSLSNFSANDVKGNIHLSLNHSLEEANKSDRLTFVGPVSLTADGLKTEKIKDIEKEPKQYSSNVVWSAFENKYFISAVVPLTGSTDKVRIEKSGDSILNYFDSPELNIEPGKSISLEYILYFGPRDLDILKNVDHELAQAIDFGFFSIIAKPLLHILKFFYSYIGNYGIAIILLTVIIKLLFWPLTHKSYASMKNMQKLQPEMQKIREKYKNNREKQNLEMMELYKTHRVNPMGGCLPMLVQIPVFFALYKVLLGAIELRQAPFAFWITDLSLKDPYYVTPLIMGATMFIQQKLTPSTMDPKQAKMFMLMPVVFTFLFLNFPSGLVIYWLVNNLLTIVQQYFIHKKA